MKCKYCAFSTSNKTVMLNHIKTYHAMKLAEKRRSTPSRSGYGTVRMDDNSYLMDNLALFAIAETLMEQNDDSFQVSEVFQGGGGEFDGGGASDTYEAPTYEAPTYDAPSYDDSSSSSSSDDNSSSDW
jgi:uncharacterized membrane protein YgcG